MRYIRKLREKSECLLDRYSESSVVAFLTVTEEEIRGYAIEITRSQHHRLPWGHALLAALKEHAFLWQDNREMLQLKSSRGAADETGTRPPKKPTPTGAQPQAPRPAAPGGGNGAKEAVKVGNCATSTHASTGAKLCKHFNDRRGCNKAKCPRGELHGCDVRLASGAACGSRSHNRGGHDQAKHGAFTARK
jgi:hypothetical protein